MLDTLAAQSGIDAYGTALPRGEWDPHALPECDYHDALVKESAAAMEAAYEERRRERERGHGQVSFVPGQGWAGQLPNGVQGQAQRAQPSGRQ